MKIYSEQSLQGFGFWSGAVDTVNELTGRELDTIEAELEMLYPDGIGETELNDLFWFEEDWIAEILGYGSWEELCRAHRGLDEDEEDED